MEIEEYCKKKGLPDFDRLNSEFDIEEIEKGNLAKKIAEKIVEKAERFRKLLEEFLHTDGSSMAVLIEIKGMNDEDRDKINKIYKELVIVEKDFLIAEIGNNEDSLIGFIKKSVEKWNSLKNGLIHIIKKAKDAWKDDIKIKEELGYLG